MTSQGSAHGRFTRTIRTRNLSAAQIALREMQDPSLLVALDYLASLAELEPERFRPQRCVGTAGSSSRHQR